MRLHSRLGDIQCVDVPFSQEREEVFYDLPLDIKGSGTLQKSLDRCVLFGVIERVKAKAT